MRVDTNISIRPIGSGQVWDQDRNEEHQLLLTMFGRPSHLKKNGIKKVLMAGGHIGQETSL